MIQYIIKLPENADINLLSEEAQAAIQAFKGQFPSGQLIGSQAVDGYELRLIMADIDGEQFNEVLTEGYPVVDEEGEETLVDLGLDWEVLAEEKKQIDQTKLLPYMLNLPVFDEEGEQTGSEPVTDLTNKLQTFAGKKWVY